MNISIRSTTNGKGIEKLMKLSGAEGVLVGVLHGGGAHPSGDGQTIAEIAWWNEFGTKNIPARPFLRTTLIEHNYYRSHLMLALQRILKDGTNPFKELKLVGSKAARDIQWSIVNGDWEANAPSTIAQKGSSRPLIDTGKLRQAISSQLEGVTE
jgi:hypothetical protein